MSDGTIDSAGLAADLQAIAQNNYIGKIKLLKLPMNTSSYPGGIYPVPLLTPGNNLILTYEALDENGIYWQSKPAAGSLSAGNVTNLAQGFARFNKRGPWLPISMFSPLMQGMASVNSNYSGNPIIGAGYSSVQMPIGYMEWQVPATFQQTGFMLAFFGLNFGLGSGIGNGNGSTYAIPSSAGPIDRERAARCP